MSQIQFEIQIAHLPIWKGVLPKPKRPDFSLFRLGWDEKGYIRQTTPENIRQQVVEYYSDDDYQFPTTPPGASSWGNARGNSAIDFVRDTYGPLTGANVLDIGGGSTYIAEKLTSEDGVAKYLIMDPSIRNKPASGKIRILRDYFTTKTCPGDNFDLIISMNCLEHVSDPVDFFEGLRLLLQRNNGKAILFFPDTETQLKNGDFNVILHEHINYFTKEMVENICKICGLRIITCSSLNDLFYCLFELGGKSSKDIIRMDKVLIRTAEAFVNNIEYFKNLIISLAQSKNNIVFHGACNGLNNLLGLSDFHNEDFFDNILIFDGDENKFGKYMPMCPNPIIDSNDSRYKKVDHVIISAMTYYRQIKKFLMSYHGISPDRIHPIYLL